MKPWTIVDVNTGKFVRQKPLVSVICGCGKEFKTGQSRIDQGRGVYCSKTCLYKYRKTKTAANHYKWSGDTPNYSALHKWIAQKYGQAMTCEFCGFESENTYQIHWANLTGVYDRDIRNWARLCARCHYHYDRSP